MTARRLAAAALAVPAAAALAACGAEIGDGCRQNFDCSQAGDRTCDRAQPGGYCTIQGCDQGTCPEEAVCVRFFPVADLVRSCATADDCGVEELCLSDGFCAPLASEQRFCMRACGGDGDCRDAYLCRETGVRGAELAQDPDRYDPDARAGYCAPGD